MVYFTFSKMFHGFFTLCALIFAFKLCEVETKNVCGIIRQREDDRIVNGREIGYRKYPWFAALFLARNPLSEVCGGTLISEKFVLTAAHCYKPYFKVLHDGQKTLEEIYIVKLNLNNVCVLDPLTQVREVNKVYIAEEYFNDLLYYDIALLELQQVVDLTPICLPKARYETNNRTNLMGTIIGLGKESSSAWRLPCTIKEANVPIQPDSTCKKMLEEQQENYVKFQGAFCAGYPEGGTDTCQGDSGGPLQVYQEGTESWMILGITSFGFGCARSNKFGIYTDVSHYINWINEKMNAYIPDNFNRSSRTPSTIRSIQKPHRKKVGKYDWLRELISI